MILNVNRWEFTHALFGNERKQEFNNRLLYTNIYLFYFQLDCKCKNQEAILIFPSTTNNRKFEFYFSGCT